MTEDSAVSAVPGTEAGTVESTPAAVATAPEKPAAANAGGFDFVRHASVAGMRRRGIWTYLGERFGEMEVRLRPFTEEAVITAKEQSEQAERMKLGLSDEEPFPAEKALVVNRDAVAAAVTGARCRIRGTNPMLELARKSGWEVDGDWIRLTGEEEEDAVRRLFRLMMEASIDLLTTLVAASRAMRRVPDEEIAKVGEGFIYGRHLALGSEV